MPIFELRCRACGSVQERYLSRASSPNPDCEDAACGGDTERLVSPFAIAFCGLITAKYNDKTKEGGHKDGHWATALRTPDGKPKPVFIETFQQQKEFCRQEGLVNPKELSSHMEATSDRKISGAGMPGAWT